MFRQIHNNLFPVLLHAYVSSPTATRSSLFIFIICIFFSQINTTRSRCNLVCRTLLRCSFTLKYPDTVLSPLPFRRHQLVIDFDNVRLMRELPKTSSSLPENREAVQHDWERSSCVRGGVHVSSIAEDAASVCFCKVRLE